MAKKGQIIFAPDFLNKLANGAGYDLVGAIAELVDNSFGANADEIKIDYMNGVFSIEDYGEDVGMDEKTLCQNFFRGGESSTDSNENAPGKFGIGGKAGILSLIGANSATISIETHKKGYQAISAKWFVRDGDSTNYEYDVFNDNSYPISTKISFKRHNLDFKREVLDRYFSVMYCWKLASAEKKIRIQDVPIQANDPLYRYNKHVIENNLFSSKTIKVLYNGEEHDIIINATKFGKKNNVIPKEELHSWDRRRGLSTANRSGLYIRTGDRYYTLGDNNFNDVMGKQGHACYDGLRIEVIIPKKLWDLIGITWNKGTKVRKFRDIQEFNTGDVNTGVCDYILSLMSGYYNETKDGVMDDSTKDIPNLSNISLEYIETGEKERPFHLNGSVLTYNKLTPAKIMGKNEAKGAINAMLVSIDVAIAHNQYGMAQEIVEKVNSVVAR